MFYFLISTCLLQENFETRKKEYINGIQSLIYNVKDIPNKKIIIIENSGDYKTSFLDYFNSYGCEVFYTNTNTDYSLEICNREYKNKGCNELMAIFNCIRHYNISDDDFIVKFTGRYLLMENSPFIQCLKIADFLNKYDVIIRYGGFNDNTRHYTKVKDCVTGLIGMRCKYIKSIPIPTNNDCIEWHWAEATFPISDDRILFFVNIMGLHMISSGGYII